MDIRGYFMHIDRECLLSLTDDSLRRMAGHRISRYTLTTWEERVDVPFVRWLTRELVLLDPVVGCRVVGRPSEWDDLPPEKSLFNSGQGRGLPIGNLTSQLFSNVFLNALDQHMKRKLGCRHYGRYVDDFYVVSADRDWLVRLVPLVYCFLRNKLGLTLHEGKTRVTDARLGVTFLGMEVYPSHRLMSRDSVRRVAVKIDALEQDVLRRECLLTAKVGEGAIDSRRRIAYDLRTSLNSFLGVMSHAQTYRLRKTLLIDSHPTFRHYGFFTDGIRHFVPYGDLDR